MLSPSQYVPVVLPALGEGIREIRVLALLKQTGDQVVKDEPLIEVETDKAVFTIESPASGMVGDWEVQSAKTYPVGVVATNVIIPDAQLLADSARNMSAVADPTLRNATISPRLRAWSRRQGIDNDTLQQMALSHPGRRLSLEDLRECESGTGGRLLDIFGRSDNATATIEMHADWEALQSMCRTRRFNHSEAIAWCTACAMASHPSFRSIHCESGGIRRTDQPRLGIAVALLHGGLALGIMSVGAVGEASLTEPEEVAVAFRHAVSAARARRKSSGAEACSVVLSDMSSFGVRSASPLVPYPAVATLFAGEPFLAPKEVSQDVEWRREFKMVLAFDHKVIDGVGAARFLRTVRQNIEAEAGNSSRGS